MEFESKHIKMEKTVRSILFPYPIHSLGYVYHAPPVEAVDSTFPDFIEIAIRLKSHDAACFRSTQLIGTAKYINHYPHAIVKYPGRSYSFRGFPERDVFYIYYDCSLTEELRRIGVFDEPLCWDIEINPEVDFLLSRLRDCMNTSQEFGVADRIDITAFQLLSELLLIKKMEKHSADTVLNTMLKIDSYLRFHVTENIDMGELAERFGLTRSSFFRYWKKYFKESPAKYFADLKLREACRRLGTNRGKIVDVADNLKFNDPSYFCAVFRKKYGLTPQEYRRRHCRNSFSNL